PQRVDERESVGFLQMPEGPPVAGIVALHGCPDTMDGAAVTAAVGLAEERGVGTHGGAKAATGIGDDVSRLDQTCLQEAAERHARLGTAALDDIEVRAGSEPQPGK